MVRFLSLALAVMLATVPYSGQAADADLALLKKHLQENIIRPVTPVSSPECLRTLRPDGTWSDINYADQSRSGWKTAEHLRRTLVLAIASMEAPADATLKKAALKAFDHWLQKDYRNPNWWHNEIGVPRAVAQTMLALDGQLTPAQFEKGIAIVAHSTIGRTGQNRVWQSGNVLMQAVLQGDITLARQARNAIAEEIVITQQEGVQPDFSFHQHGPQQQFGNYGLAYASDISYWAGIFHGSSLAFSDAQQKILRDYLLRGESQVLWQGMMDISACGRQLSPGTQEIKAQSLLHVFQAMGKIDPAHAAEYEAVLAENKGKQPAEARNTLFWRSDFLVHRRPGFDLSVKMNSRRVKGTECVNDENLKGYALADGATYIYRTGREYEDIFPVWNWRALPGVTYAQDSAPLHKTNARGVDSDFVGGVSDGTFGAAVLDYRRDGITAKKSWFCFSNSVVCLGAGITSSGTAPLATAVNQCLLHGPVTVEGGKTTSGRQELEHLRWAHHDGVGYLFPGAPAVTLSAGPQTGAWHEVYSGGSPEKITKEIFSLGINHGVQPANATYAYIILPNITSAKTAELAEKPDVEILRNTQELQAVRNAGQKVTFAIFYRPGQITCQNGAFLSVDKPCALILRETAEGPVVSLADPSQKQPSVTVTLAGKSSQIALPTGPQAGSSVTNVRL